LGITRGGSLYKHYKEAKINIKTIRCNPGLKVIETMSLRGYNYDEIISQKWENSKLISDTSNILIIVLELPEENSHQKEALFKTILLHKPTQKDIEIIKKDWLTIVSYIKQKKAGELVAGIGEIIQTRPKARDKKDTAVAPGNHKVVKKGFFIRTFYLQKILDNYNFNKDYFDSLVAIDTYDIPENIRIRTNILRVIRDTEMTTKLKEKYDNKCQICSKRITIFEGENIRYYSEAHHLKPLAQIHNGPDIEGNIIILCPNHHVEFDYGVIAINPEDSMTIIHKEKDNQFNSKKITLKHKILDEFIKYHFRIFKQRVFEKNVKMNDFF